MLSKNLYYGIIIALSEGFVFNKHASGQLQRAAKTPLHLKLLPACRKPVALLMVYPMFEKGPIRLGRRDENRWTHETWIKRRDEDILLLGWRVRVFVAC